MIVTVETKKFGPVQVPVDVAPTLEGLVEQFGAKAVYHAATVRSLTSLIRDYVRGAARADKDAATVIAEAQAIRLLPPSTRTSEEIRQILSKLTDAPDDDLASALEAMTQEEKDAIIARLVS